MKNKAQMKIQQMAVMLIAVTLFFILVGLFVLMFKVSQIKDSATNLAEGNALTLAMKLANSPEFSCEKSFGSKLSCIDADKVMMLKKNIKDYQITSSGSKTFWGDEVNMEIDILYPTKDKKECTTATYPNCNVINLMSKPLNSTEANFVILCRKDTSEGLVVDKCELAKLMVNYRWVQ